MPNLPLFFYFLISVLIFAYGERKVVILKNNETPVAWTLVAVNGENLTLTCKIVDSNNSQFSTNETLWVTPLFDLGFNTGDRIYESERGKLCFTPVRLKDDGTYSCLDVKQDFAMRLKLIVVSANVTFYKKKHSLYGYEYYPLGLPINTDDRLEHKSKTNIWAIVGGVCGLILGSVALWFCFKNSVTNDVAFTRAIRIGGPRNSE